MPAWEQLQERLLNAGALHTHAPLTTTVCRHICRWAERHAFRGAWPALLLLGPSLGTLLPSEASGQPNGSNPIASRQHSGLSLGVSALHGRTLSMSMACTLARESALLLGDSQATSSCSSMLSGTTC